MRKEQQITEQVNVNPQVGPGTTLKTFALSLYNLNFLGEKKRKEKKRKEKKRKEKKRKEKKRLDYAFRRQFNEKPSIIPGCPELPGCFYQLQVCCIILVMSCSDVRLQQWHLCMDGSRNH